MKKKIVGASGFLLIALSTAAFADRVFQTSEMLVGIGSDAVGAQGAAWLRRSPDRVDGRIMVKVDKANTAHTIWMIVFNNPEYCAGATMDPPMPCNAGDLVFNKDMVGGAVFHSSGAISAADGGLKTNGKPAGGGVINVDVEVVAGEGSSNGHADFPPLPDGLFPFTDLNGILELGNGCGSEIHFDVNEHAVFDEGWVTELTQPEGETQRFAIFPAVDCEGGDE